MYGIVRRYRFDPKMSDQVDRHIRIGVVAPIREIEGFIAYYWVDTGAGEGISLSVFEDQAGAERSTRVTADYVHQHLHELVGEPEITEGKVAAHAPD